MHVHHSHDGATFAVITTGAGRITISGPADGVAATLRELADKVDAERCGKQVTP